MAIIILGDISLNMPSVSGNNTFVSGIKKILQNPVAILPIITTPVSVDSFIRSTGGMEGWAQRGVLGAAAILTQPFIDLNNKDVDKETRKYSAVKTAVKVLIGTSMGMATRYSFGTVLAKWPAFVGNLSNSFIKLPTKNPDQFTTGVSLLVGTVGTVITTFFIDKPLTNPLMNASLKFFNISEKPKTEVKK